MESSKFRATDLDVPFFGLVFWMLKVVGAYFVVLVILGLCALAIFAFLMALGMAPHIPGR